MTKTYVQIVQQIEALKQEAESLRQAEVAQVTSKIREAIQVYGLTAADLGLSVKRKSKGIRGKAATGFPYDANGAKSTKSTKSTKGPGRKNAAAGKRDSGAKSGTSTRQAKYRNDTGGAWGGIGKRPQWLRDALAAGKKLEDFAVN